MRSGELCDFITQSLKASDSKLNAMDRYIQRAKDRFEAKENSNQIITANNYTANTGKGDAN